MKIDKHILDYLHGKAFSNSIVFEVTRERQLPVSREDAIIQIIRGSDVIHLGCADHLELIEEKIKSGRWLHKMITENSSSCLGIDISSEGINYMTGTLGYTNVIKADILTDPIEEIKSKSWDWVIFGELIEHLDNPVEFLSAFREKFGAFVKRFLVTVPSIYYTNQLRNMKSYRETINSDHRFWFTPYTISKVLAAAGYNPEDIEFGNLQSLDKISLIKRKIKSFAGVNEKYPYYFFNTIIVTGTLK